MNTCNAAQSGLEAKIAQLQNENSRLRQNVSALLDASQSLLVYAKDPFEHDLWDAVDRAENAIKSAMVSS